MGNKPSRLDPALPWLTAGSTAVTPKRRSCEIYSPENAFLRLNGRTFTHFTSKEWGFVMPGDEHFDLDEPSLVRAFYTAEQNSFDPPEQVWYDDVYPLSQVESLYPGISLAILTFHEMGASPADIKDYIYSLLQDPSLLSSTTLELPALAVGDSPA